MVLVLLLPVVFASHGCGLVRTLYLQPALRSPVSKAPHDGLIVQRLLQHPGSLNAAAIRHPIKEWVQHGGTTMAPGLLSWSLIGSDATTSP
jgi:hypothetical protein